MLLGVTHKHSNRFPSASWVDPLGAGVWQAVQIVSALRAGGTAELVVRPKLPAVPTAPPACLEVRHPLPHGRPLAQ